MTASITTIPEQPYRAAQWINANVLGGDWFTNSETSWRHWTGTHWAIATNREQDNLLYPILDAADWEPNKNKLNGIRDGLRSILWRPDAKPGHTLDGLKLPRGLLPVANGVLDVGTGELMPHNRDHFTTFCLPWSYDPEATCPTWEAFVSSIFDGEAESVRLLRQWLGYIVSGRTDLQRIMLLKGLPGSGKGTTVRLIQKLVGMDSVSAFDFQSAEAWWDNAGHIGKTLAVDADADVTGPKAQRALKLVLKISGEDVIRARTPKGPPTTESLAIRFLLAANEVPAITNNSGALLRRLSVLVTARSFVGAEDRDLDAKLEAELPGIAAWAVAGLRDLEDCGDFVSSPSAVSAVEFMREQLHPVERFVSEMGWTITRDESDWLPKMHVYQAYKEWAKREGMRVESASVLSREFDSVGVRSGSNVQNRVDGKLTQTYRGIC